MGVIEEFHTILYTDLSWHAQALCKGATDVFFPDRGKNNDIRYAKRICSKCPVQQDCMNYAIKNNIKHGIWGGLAYKERLKVKKSKL